MFRVCMKHCSNLRATVTGVFCVFALSTAVTMTSAKAEDHRGLYVGILGIGSFAKAEDLKTTGITSLSENNTEDPVAGAGVTLGYRFEDLPLRTELELSHRFRFDLDLRVNPNGGSIGFENNVSTTSLLGNVAVEMRHWDSLTPYLGATVGLVQNSSEIERTVIIGNTITRTENDTTDLALGIFGGVTWAWTETFGMDLGYRFINLGAIDYGSLAGGETIEYENYVSSELLLNFYANF